MTVRPGDACGGSMMCLCPEAKNALVGLSRHRTVTVCYSGQHVFELGVMWALVAFGEHPLPDYPGDYETSPPDRRVVYTDDLMTGVPPDDGEGGGGIAATSSSSPHVLPPRSPTTCSHMSSVLVAHHVPPLLVVTCPQGISPSRSPDISPRVSQTRTQSPSHFAGSFAAWSAGSRRRDRRWRRVCRS